MDALPPPFALDVERYDLSTFSGRLSKVCAQFDPLKLFKSDQDIEDAKALIAAFRDGGKAAARASDAELWGAKELLDSRLHPDTGEQIPVRLQLGPHRAHAR